MMLLGVATWYNLLGPLYCDQGQGLIYDEETIPWLALSEDLYKSGWAQCGDRIQVEGDGWTIILLALDAGPLHRYYIEDFPDQPILVDIPQHLVPFSTMSQKVTVRNLDRVRSGPRLTR